MKKFFALMLSLIMVLSLFAGCNGSDTGDGEFSLSSDVEFVCPFSAGGGSDLYARTVANIHGGLGLLGDRTITVNNKPGGGGAVGDAYTYTKSGDGTTITTYVSAQITSPITSGSGITYDQMTPICNLAMDEYTIGVLSTAEYQTVDEFLAYAEAHPGEITVGGSGSGTEDELCTGLIEVYCGVDLEYIPYDSTAEVLSAVLGGHIAAGIFNPNEAMSQYEAGEITLLGAFGPERISVLPDIPTFTELGYEDVQFQQFRVIFGPGNMEQAAVDFWVDVFSQVVEHEDWTEGYLAPNGLTSSFISGEEFATFIDEEASKYQSILDELGLSANS